MSTITGTTAYTQAFWGAGNGAAGTRTPSEMDYQGTLDKMAQALDDEERQADAAARALRAEGTNAPVNTAFLAQQLAQEKTQTAVTAEDDEAVASVSAEEDEDEQSAAVEKFLEYMSKTPEERYFEAFLKSKGMTQEDFDALSPEDQQALVEEFREAVKQRVAETSAEKVAQSSYSGLL